MTYIIIEFHSKVVKENFQVKLTTSDLILLKATLYIQGLHHSTK